MIDICSQNDPETHFSTEREDNKEAVFLKTKLTLKNVFKTALQDKRVQQWL